MKILRRLPMKWRVAAVFVAVGAIWGSAWIPTAALPQTEPRLLVGTLRFALAAALLAVVAALDRLRQCPDQRQPMARLLIPSALMGITMVGLPYALTVWASGRVSPGVTALCFGLMPLLVLLFEGEEQERAIPAVVLGIGGVAMVVAPGVSFRSQQAAGLAALLTASGLSAFSYLYVRRLFAVGRLGRENILNFCAIQSGVASVLLAMLLASIKQEFTFPLDATAALPLMVLAIVVSGGTLPLFFWLLHQMAAWQVATLQWVSTLVAAAEAAWVVHARPAAASWVGAVLVPACIFWIFLQSKSASSGAVTPEITEHTFALAKASDFKRKSE
jgi:drug/metabolite transporter (DMT)-like permease